MDSFKIVSRRRDKLSAAAWSVIEQFDQVDSFALARIVDVVLHNLPPKCRYDAVFRSATPLIGPRPTRETVRDYAWALAANVPALRAGEVVAPGRPVPGRPVMVQIRGSKLFRTRFRGKTDPAAVYSGRMMVGPGAPHEFTWRWSLKFVRFVACRVDGLGFDKPRIGSTRPFRHHRSLVGMRITVVTNVVDGKLKITSVACPGALRDYNRTLIDMREAHSRRLIGLPVAPDAFACPFNYSHHCHACIRGRDACPATVRLFDVRSIVCARCSKTITVDPFWGETLCGECASKGGAERM